MEQIEVQRLARSINLIRPDWPVGSLETFIRRREHMTPVDLHLQLVYVAHDPKTTTPARIDQLGPWKYLFTGAKESIGVQVPYFDPGVVIQREDRATPEQIAAVRKAAIENATTTEEN
jgi:hypothetical protein